MKNCAQLQLPVKDTRKTTAYILYFLKLFQFTLALPLNILSAVISSAYITLIPLILISESV